MAKHCVDCGKKLGIFSADYGDYCLTCFDIRRNETENELQQKRAQEQENKLSLEAARNESTSKLLVTTETAATDLVVEQRLGVVTAEVVIGMHLFKDISIGLRNTVGGRSETYQKDLREMREQAIDEIKLEAHELGANAVIAMDLDYQEIGSKGQSMLMLVASGTAVKLAGLEETGH